MYRWTLPILLCITVHSAPQDSDITYVKIQPLNTDQQATATRESRTDPLTPSQEEIIHQSENTTTQASSTSKLDLSTTIDPISESIDPSLISKLNRIATDDPNRLLSNLTQNNHETPYRFVRSDVTSNYDTTTDAVTETEKDLRQTIKAEARTRAPLRYLSKLSYYKTTASYGGSEVNQLERGGKRRFRSKCRCEKIWNCPKLQITVPRCPDEYFLCCF